MSNNPLEAVTQAVNSLVTALKLPMKFWAK